MPYPQYLPQLQGYDSVSVRNVHAETLVGADAWGRMGKPQPANVSVSLYLPVAIREAAQNDDVERTLNYSKLCKGILETMQDGAGFSTLASLAAWLDPLHPDRSWYPREIDLVGWRIEIVLPKAVLRSTSGITFLSEHYCKAQTADTGKFLEIFRVDDIQCACIIGVNEHERLEKQPVSISLTFQALDQGLSDQPPHLENSPVRVALLCYQNLVKAITTAVDKSKFLTVEALATSVAKIATIDFHLKEVTVQVKKPFAIPRIEGPVVEITRKKSFFD